MRLRFARADERETLEDLLRRASLANDGDREALLAHPEVIHLPAVQIAQRRVVVADDSDRALGFAVVLAPQDGVAELDGIFVEPAHWRRGVGRALLDECLGMAAGEGAAAVHVVANLHALDFYEALGFVRGAPVHTRFGTAVAMTRALRGRA